MNARRVAGGVLAALLLAGATLAAPPRLAALVDEALGAGADARLPPNLALVLGLADTLQPAPVRQIAARVEHEMRAFNVSLANHRDLVMFTVDEQTQVTTAFLLGPDGRLRKAVSYAAGAEPVTMTQASARKPFERELAFWSGGMRPHAGEQ